MGREEKSTERWVVEAPGAWFAGPLWSVQSTSKICLSGWTLGALIDLLPTPWARLPIRVLPPCTSDMQKFEGWVDPFQSRSQGRKGRAEQLALQVCEPCHPLPPLPPCDYSLPWLQKKSEGKGGCWTIDGSRSSWSSSHFVFPTTVPLYVYFSKHLSTTVHPVLGPKIQRVLSLFLIIYHFNGKLFGAGNTIFWIYCRHPDLLMD